MLFLQIADHRTGCKAFIQVQHPADDAQDVQPLQEDLQNIQGLLLRQDIADRQVQAHLFPNHVGRGNAHKMGGALLGLPVTGYFLQLGF
jgi:hypothetical protein